MTLPRTVSEKIENLQQQENEWNAAVMSIESILIRS